MTAYFWTVKEVVRERLFRFLFAEAGDERSQVADLVARVEIALDREAEDIKEQPAAISLPDADGNGRLVGSFDELCELIRERLEPDDSPWRGFVAPGTVSAFLRRLDAARIHCGHLIKGSNTADLDEHRIDWRALTGLGHRHPQPA